MECHNVSNRTEAPNITDDYDVRDEELIPRGVSVLGATGGIIIIALGVFGNMLLMLAVIKSSPLLKASNSFVVSLAACDLFQTVMVRPLFVYTYIAGRWELSGRMCLYALYASNLAILESILHVSAIAFYRYVILVHPRAARQFQKPRSVVFLICLIFILPLVIVLAPSAPTLLKSTVMDKDLFFNTRIMFCGTKKQSEIEISLAGILKKAAFLGMAGLFLFYCYIRIYIRVRQSGRLVCGIDGAFSPVRVRREITLLKTIVVVFATFVVSYLPVTILYAVDQVHQVPYAAYVATVLLLWMSSSINWMIYGLMNKQYRQAYRFVLCGQHKMAVPSTIVQNNGSNLLNKKKSNRESFPNGSHNGYSSLEMPEYPYYKNVSPDDPPFALSLQ